MTQQKYGKLYSLYTVNGYDWDKLDSKEQSQLKSQLMGYTFHGEVGERYGFASTRVNEDVFYGHFTQQFEQVKVLYPDPSHRVEETEHSFADRFYLFVPKRNLFVLERRNFIRQPGLTPRGTEARIEKLLQDALPKYYVSMEKFSHELTQDQMREYFRSYPVVGLQVSGLRGRKVPQDFIFFNPHYDKNAISRELFDEKILPYTDTLEVYSEAFKDKNTAPAEVEDLRKNGLARMAAEVSPEIKEIAIHHPERGRQFVKPRYDDTLRTANESVDGEKVAIEIVERIREIPDIQKDINMRQMRQVQLSDLEELE